MHTFITNWPRLFTYASTLTVVFMLAIIWVHGLHPLIDDYSALHNNENGLYLFYVFLMILIGLFIPLFISFSKVARQQLINDFIRSTSKSSSSSEEALLEAIDIIPAGIVMYDSNDQLILCNTRFRDIWGYSESDTPAGVTHQELGQIDRQRGVKVAGVAAEDYMETRLDYRSKLSEEQVIELPDGRLISTKDRPLHRGGFISIQTDITELVEARNCFHNSEQQLLDAIEGLDEGFASFDKNDRLVMANSTFKQMYPSHEKITAGSSFNDLINLSVSSGDIPAAIGCEEEWIATRLEQHHNQTPIDEKQLSNGRWIKVTEHRTANGGTVCISTDISEAKKHQTILELYATTDEMTGVMNRRTGTLMLNKLMAQFQRSDGDLTICYIDIDELKNVNDRYGHDSGDLLIKIISKAAKKITREGDIIMRLGGDEFLIVFPDCSVLLANTKMNAIKQQLNQVKIQEKYLFDLNFSYGTAAYSAESFSDAEEYITQADKLMYKNKLEQKTVQ